jgi:hypothetical protein
VNCLPNSEEQVLVQYDTNEPATLFLLMSMSAHTFTTLFICIEPFKATLLSYLAPFDIAKFGSHNRHTSLLCGIPNLMVCCLKMAREQTIYQQLPANLTMNALHKVYAAEFKKCGTGMETLTMFH